MTLGDEDRELPQVPLVDARLGSGSGFRVQGSKGFAGIFGDYNKGSGGPYKGDMLRSLRIQIV